MRQFLVRFFWTAVVAAVLYGGYVLYVRWWEKGGANGTANIVKTVQTQAPKVAGEAETKAENYATKVISEASGSAGSFIKQQVGSALSGAAQTVLQGALSLFNPSAPVASPLTTGTISVPVGSGFNVPPPQATIITKINTPLTVSINRGTSYTVDWGDGKFESGEITSDSVRVLNHSWAAPGDYSVKVTVKESDTTNAYSFPIRVFE